MQDPLVFKENVSEERLLSLVKEVSAFHRIQASPMYREAAYHVLKIAKGYGLKAQILSYEADPDVWYLQSKMFKEWSIKEATLDLVEPAVRLADYSKEALSVIQKSMPIDRRKEAVDLLLLDKGSDPKRYEDSDLRGKFVFIRGPLRKYDWVYEKGALGVISDYIMENRNRKRADLYDALAYTSYWPSHLENEAEYRGFVLSPRCGDELAELCRKQYEKDGTYLKVKPYIDSSFDKGHIEVVEVTIEGRDDKTVYLLAHLCHPRPSCNDNASGVAAGLEAMNVINRLIVQGKIRQPQHTIRLILMPEFTGTYAYLSDHDDYAKGLGGLNLDMVGGKQDRHYGPITLTKTPYSTPALNNELCLIAMDFASEEAWSLSDDPVALTNQRIEPYSGGSDHTVYCDPTINIPCCMLGQWPDLNYHSSADTLEVIDPAVLKFSCLTAIGFAYTLADLKKEDLPYLFNKLEGSIVADKEKYTAEYLKGLIDKRCFGSLMYLLKDHYQKCCDSAAKLVTAYDAIKEKQHIAQLFDSWIAYYDLQDDYPLDESLNKVYRRNFRGPIQQFSDYLALGHADALAEFRESISKDPVSMMGLIDPITNLIDGRRTTGEIVRLVSVQERRDAREAVLVLLKLYEKLKLVSEV